MKKKRAEVTSQYEVSPKREVLMPLMCSCRSFKDRHPVSRHRELRSDMDWRTWQERRDPT
jgi:hypothetical protein